MISGGDNIENMRDGAQLIAARPVKKWKVNYIFPIAIG